MEEKIHKYFWIKQTCGKILMFESNEGDAKSQCYEKMSGVDGNGLLL